MPTKIYHADMRKVPRETRLSGQYKRAGVVMDHAMVSFVELMPEFNFPAEPMSTASSLPP